MEKCGGDSSPPPTSTSTKTLETFVILNHQPALRNLIFFVGQ